MIYWKIDSILLGSLFFLTLGSGLMVGSLLLQRWVHQWFVRHGLHVPYPDVAGFILKKLGIK